MRNILTVMMAAGIAITAVSSTSWARSNPRSDLGAQLQFQLNEANSILLESIDDGATKDLRDAAKKIEENIETPPPPPPPPKK